jgi:GH15 family glucan-1,4-alpha-glucosidase
LDWRVAWARAGIALAAAVLVAGLALSGGTATDAPAPSGYPGVVPAFLAKAGSKSQDRRWVARAKPLDGAAPPWARRMYRRSLLVLRALVGPNGAAVAGAPPGWGYVWPRDAGAVAIALASAGYRMEARRIARFLLALDLGVAARFDPGGEPVEGRAAQGDAAGWVAAAAFAAGVEVQPRGSDWRGLADYQEKDGGDYLGNALAAAFAAAFGEEPGREAESSQARELARGFVAERGLIRVAGDANSGLDSAAAWVVRPFSLPSLHAAARRTLLQLVAERESRFGLVPSEDWDGGEEPWTAPTAWTAWSLAALGERRAALTLMGDLRRAATPLGLLPERVDPETGRLTSTTPLAWSHAFAILAIRELWP